jgi:hypothetical protein
VSRSVGQGRVAGRRSEDAVHDVGAFGGDGEAPSIAQVIRARVERPVGRQHGGGGEVEIGCTARTVFLDELHHAGGSLHALPLDAVFAGDNQAGLQALCRGEDFTEQLGLRGIAGVVQHGRSDIRRSKDSWAASASYSRKNLSTLRLGEAAGVIGEWLSADCARGSGPTRRGRHPRIHRADRTGPAFPASAASCDIRACGACGRSSRATRCAAAASSGRKPSLR